MRTRHKNYTDEDFYEGVIHYKNSSRMKKDNPPLYHYGVRHKLIENANWPVVKRRKLTDEDFYDGVIRYRSPSNMDKNDPGLYSYGAKHGLLRKTNWPEKMTEPFTDEDFYEGVVRYRSPSNMDKNDPGLYNYGLRHGLVKNADWPERKSRHGLTEEEIKKIVFDAALDCTSNGDLEKKHPKEYNLARNHNLLGEISWFKPKMNRFADNVYFIYAYFFVDHAACYVGLSNRTTAYDRDKGHRKDNKSQVYIFAKDNNIEIPERVIVESGLNVDNVQEREDYWRRHYAAEGWKMLNVGKTGRGSGALGGGFIKWTYRKCYELAKKCNSRAEMKRKNYSAYQAAVKNKWMDDYTWFVDLVHRAVDQYDLNGNFIRRHACLKDAARTLGHSTGTAIGYCCRGRDKTAYGYVWKYAEDVPAKPVQTLLAI